MTERTIPVCLKCEHYFYMEDGIKKPGKILHLTELPEDLSEWLVVDHLRRIHGVGVEVSVEGENYLILYKSEEGLEEVVEIESITDPVTIAFIRALLGQNVDKHQRGVIFNANEHTKPLDTKIPVNPIIGHKNTPYLPRNNI